MTVLTGETGAGKSIIIDAMNMMLGSRATTDVIRHGAPKAEIEGLFTVESNRHLTALFEEQGLEWTDELIIRREILQNGRKCQPDQWSDGEFICLKGSRATFGGHPWPA